MKYLFLLAILIITFSCSKEEQNCTTSHFIGTWTVVENICSIDNSSTIEIWAGDTPSKIKLILDSDTLSFVVTNCEARHKNSDFLLETEATLTLDDNELHLEYQSQVAILPIFCTMTLRK